jgi:hypothetical protein
MVGFLALPTNTRLGWKGLPGTNTLAYYENPYITAAISFMKQALPVEIFCDSQIESFMPRRLDANGWSLGQILARNDVDETKAKLDLLTNFSAGRLV